MRQQLLKAARKAIRLGLREACALPVLRERLCWHGPRSSGSLALTFDDGPNPGFTPQVLDLLSRHHAHATFFLLGNAIEKHPQLVREIVSRGHALGTHSYDHQKRNLPEQTRRTRRLLQDLGFDTLWFRPPGGYLDRQTLLWHLRSGYHTALWNFDTHDSMRYQGKVSEAPRYHELRGGDIVLLHDDTPVCLHDLEKILRVSAERNLRAITLPQLLG